MIFAAMRRGTGTYGRKFDAAGGRKILWVSKPNAVSSYSCAASCQ